MPRTNQQIKRRTTRAVYLWDRLASGTITVGGVAILAAVLGICVYLFWTVFPLFKTGSVHPEHASQIPPTQRVATIVAEYGQALASIDQSGTLTAYSLKSGLPFHQATPFEGKSVTAAATTAHGPAALALSDGSLHLGSFSLTSSLLSTSQLTPDLQALNVGDEVFKPAAGEEPAQLIQRVRDDQWRTTSVHNTLKESQAGADDLKPIIRLDLRDNGSGGRFIAAIRSDGAAQLGSVSTITPLGGDEPIEEVSAVTFTLSNPAKGIPDWVFTTADGRHVFSVWSDGTLERYAPRSVDGSDTVSVAETTTLVTPPTRLTTANMLLGGYTLLVGDDQGKVHAFQPARDSTSPAFDAMRLVESASFKAGDAPVYSIAPSERERVVAAATIKGDIVLRHMTSQKEVAHLAKGSGGLEPTLAFSPKGDTLVALAKDAGYQTWAINQGHADASLAALFGAIRYEGELNPQYIYQSSAGGEGAEVKLSLIPLIFGTLKATIVAMLIAIPLAVLGAIYTSEFMHKDLRKFVKPTIELMASLPSVVLGFIAAMVVAPFMARHLPGVLVAIVLTPVFLGLFAHLWQMVPRQTAHRINRRARILLIGSALTASLALAALFAGPVERALFKPNRTDILLASGSYQPLPRDQWPAWVGTRDTMSPSDERALRAQGLAFRSGQVVQVTDNANADATAAGPASIKRWLDGSIGDPYPGWLLALLVPSLLVVFFAQARFIDRARFETFLGSSAKGMAAAELIRYAIVIIAGLALAAALAFVFTKAGLDTRDSIFGPFSQRNSLVVGVIMGFAVIPIIYTISEDALRAVPNHLRSASLGVGATPWQTAVRVVLPAAASGVFSAIMIGLGRAVGETMIVLMATGNTPEISTNLFSGLRTLAANIAVELPEAVRGGTHYRVLFLCGLVLFLLTFAINTTAEIVRQRFRKRNAAL